MSPDRLRQLPYLVHTNRELGLMLRRAKPLAMFSFVVGQELPVLQRYMRMFDRHVSLGRLTKRAIRKPAPQAEDIVVATIFYALPDEHWRIDAMLALVAEPGRWTAERERRLGELLGYEDWQNDFWLERTRGGSVI